MAGVVDDLRLVSSALGRIIPWVSSYHLEGFNTNYTEWTKLILTAKLMFDRADFTCGIPLH